MTTADPATLALTGQLPFILVLAALLSLPLSFLLLRLYRRAILRGMSRRDSTPAAAVSAPSNPASPPAPLSITYASSAHYKQAEVKTDLYLRSRSALQRAAAVYVAGGAVFAAVMALGFLRAGGMELLPMRFLLLFWIYAWPLVMTLALVVAATARTRLLLAVGYAAVYALLALAGILRSPDSSISQLLILWSSTNLPPTILFLVFLLRQVRAVGPLVVTFMVLAITGSNLLLSVLNLNQALLRSVAGFFFSLGLGGTATLVVITVIGFVIFSVLGWFALQWLRRSYQAKRVNDQTLVLDALWFLFGISYAIGFVFEGAAWITAGLVAFAGYMATVWLGFRILAPGGSAKSNSRLLILRVFSLGKRSETLFEAVTRHWRYLGSVQLIAGPDLAAATVEPHEFLDFVSGRLERQFISSPESLDRRLAEQDTIPDFDGRFRVNDFFCHDDIWQKTLAALVLYSDVVLMDLRGFSPDKQGCVYEIRQLLHLIPLQRIVLLTDATTDLDFLERTLKEAWNDLPSDAANRWIREPRLTVIEGERSTDAILHPLIAVLCSAATV